MLRCAVPLAAVGVLATANLQAQDRRLIDRLDPVTATAVQQLVDSARAAQLPSEPLVQKALEGATLGAGGDRIRNAVGTLLGQLDRARGALGSAASEAELTAGAGALRAGLSVETLQRLQAMRPGQPLVVPLSVPALAAFAIFQFLWVWNDLLVAYVFLGGTRDTRVVTIALANLAGSRAENWHLLTSAAFISMALPLLVFFTMQRYFVRGLTAGSVKG